MAQPFIRPVRTVLTVVALLFASALAAADWAQFRGPGGQGVSGDKGLPTSWGEAAGVVWKTDLPGAGASSPIILGGRIYIVSRQGRCWVLPAKPAFEVLATNELGRVGTVNSSPAVAGGRLYIRTDKSLFCLGK